MLIKMPRPCGSKSQKLGLNVNPSAKCTFKIEFPPLMDPDNSHTRMKAERNFGPNKLNCTENPISTNKLRFQCHFEERKRRAEFRRKKIIQKLKKNYAIDVEGLNEDVTREIILKAEMLEKEKRQREKRNVERMMTMITRLLEEQKYKNRGSKIFPSSKKAFKTIQGPKFIEQVSEKQSDYTGYVGDISSGSFEKGVGVTGDSKTGLLGDGNLSKNSLELKPSKISAQEEQREELPKCVDVKEDEEAPWVVPYTKLVKKPRPSCMPTERCLESTPKCVVFNNYEKGKVYLQDLRITNIGVETIHCRYLGIVVHTKGEDRFPVGVAVRDNVKLRPGLCCSTKIRLCSQEDTKELRCSVVYETRRQKNPLQHSWFFVPVVCVPVRAIVRAFPQKITFPSLTWCEATGTEGTKLLSKFLKIENSGGKACSCRISKVTLRTDKNEESAEDEEDEENEEDEEDEEEEEEEEGEDTKGDKDSIKSKSLKPEVRNSQYKNFNHLEEFDGEGYVVPCGNAEDTAKSLVDELFDNIFAPFRFSIRYFIYIPPSSTVQIEVRFLPNYKGFHHEVYFLQFEDCDNYKEVPVELVGDIKQIPLRLEPQVIDLKTCIANSGVYSATFTIFNESKGPYSVALKIPSSMKKHAHVYPKATTLLPLHSSDFSVRIYPRVTLARDAPRYYNENSQVLEFPVFIYPANFGVCKRDSLKIYIFALITDYCLELSPTFINFGTVTTLETVRAEMELTNHSLAVQEYGFLNLPKGVRVEPNMGFGKILPKETITLYLLYSPGEDLMGCDNAEEVHEFQIAVTSIAKHGGFREKLELDEKSTNYSDLIWEEDYSYEFSAANVNSYSDDQLQPEDPEDFDVCEEESSIEGEEFCTKLYQQENMIREYLHGDVHKVSEHSLFNRMKIQAQDSHYRKYSETENRRENVSEFGEFEGSCEFKAIYAPKPDLHIVNCRARIVQPRCRISETVIQLPATSCSSFSLYRFRLDCVKVQGDINCSCGFKRIRKCGEKSFPSRFEFQYLCPNIKLEPESGFIKPGDSLPVTIIHRPEIPAEQLQYESRLNKSQKSVPDVKGEMQSTPIPKCMILWFNLMVLYLQCCNEKIIDRKNCKFQQSVGKQNTLKNKILESTSKISIEDIRNVASFELDNSDLFGGKKNLSKLISPFHLVTKLQCVIKTASCDDRNEKTEIHEMVLICPAIKPNFIYLGNSQEIKFNKVFVGTRSKTILQLQNISLERASPSATLLNPTGPFYCPAGVKKVEVDPEHIWRQPLVYAPLEKGIEKQFFEIYCDSTNIFLAVSGEAIMPEYKIIPNFACCQIEAKPGTSEELKLEMENLSHITMRIYVKTDFSKEGPDEEIQLEEEENTEEETKTKKAQKEDVKGEKKKLKNLGNENFQFWDAVPEIINSILESFEDISEEDSKAFSFLGVNDNDEILIPPLGKQQIKILFEPPTDKNDKKHAVKYVLMLEGVTSLKEVIIIGKISRGK